MAIKIPIITVFDSKGLKQAQYQLNKVRGNFQNLGRNAAIAGVALGAVAAVLGKSVQAAAEAQKVMAQTEAVLKSTGTTANGTAADIANLSLKLMRQTAVDDEAIQSGANLLLTFKNIQNQAGANNDIFDQTVAATLDVARAMGTDASTEAIRLGKALNDPVKGISALSRVGIQFTAQQKDQIKTLTETGDLLGAQKIILAELQSQFGGSAQAYAATFAGQVELLNAELENLSEDIGVMVMPAIQEMVGAFRELAPEIGEKLKTAIASVDWKAFTKTIVDLITFLVQNAEMIIKVSVALFALNTAYNLGRVAVGLYNAGVVITNALMNGTSIATTLATGALKLFKIALLTTGIGAFVVALGFIIQGATEVDSTYRQTTPVVTSFGTAVLKTGKDSEWAASKYGVATVAVNKYTNAVRNMPNVSLETNKRKGEMNSYLDFLGGKAASVVPKIKFDENNNGGTKGIKAQTKSLKATLKREGTILKKEAKLVGAGLSAGLADKITSSSKPIKAANKILARISKNGDKAVKNIQKKFNATKAGQSELASISAKNEAANEAAAAAEAARLAEKKRVYDSFLDSVKNTFGRIKDSILNAFSLPELGGSTDSIIRNMKKLLTATRNFSTNITKLSQMGLNPELLQQVIAAGPMAGGNLAAALVAGGAGAIAEISAGFSDFQGLAGQIATTGTTAQFGTTTQQNIYNIEVNGGVGSGATIGQSIVEAIKAYERVSGAVWQGA